MAARSLIEWTEADWTPIRARNRATGKIGRLGTDRPFKPGHRKDIDLFLDEDMLLAPLGWKKPRMVFVCSTTDLFAEFVSVDWIDRIFAMMALCPQHIFQVLTKRAGLMQQYVSKPRPHGGGILTLCCELAGRDPGPIDWPLPNVWLGVSCERQQEADERIPLLLQTPAAVRFVSAEPLLGPIILWNDCEGVLRGPGVVISGGMTVSTPHGPAEGYDDSYPGLDWVIASGESGPNARPMHPLWALDIRDQCQAARVPFFFKQWGAWGPSWDHGGRATHTLAIDGTLSQGDKLSGGPKRDPRWVPIRRVGKKAAGRLLDGREWNEFPVTISGDGKWRIVVGLDDESQ